MRKKRFRGYCAAGCGNAVFSLKTRAKYCSLMCARARYGERDACPTCGAVVPTRKKRYCTIKCHHEFLFRKRVAQLENGNYPPFRTTSYFVRRYLIRSLGERCSKCGWAEKHPTTGNVPVEIEHIDGDWQNNAIDNLTLLCPNCHALTPTYRALNRGRGRPLRVGGRENSISKHAEKDARSEKPK